MARLAFAAALAAAAALSAPLARADFPEKNIDFIIPFAPGGGFDRTVRALAPFMEKALGGRVSVVPRNVPGAGGRRGLATVYRAKPDGYAIAIANVPGAQMPQLVGEKVEYDPSRFSWIARVGAEEYVLGVAGKSSLRTLEDLRKLGRPVKVTSTGFGSTAYAGMALFAEVLELPVQFLTGYKGSKAYMVGVIRGDGDATTGPVSTMRKFIESGDMRAVFTTEAQSSLKEVPTIASLGHPELTGVGVERFVVGPPGMPQRVVQAISDAIAKAIADPELQAIAKKSQEPFAFVPAAKAKAAAKRSIAIYEKHKAALQKR